MHRNTHAIQRFLWWVAGADAEKLSDPLMPRSQGLRYEAIGLAICAITVLAMGGWFHQGSLIFLSRAHTYPMAVALAVVMGCLMFLVERLLIVSLHPELTLDGKLLAILWRSAIALINATILMLPIALGYFANDITMMLDNQRIDLMQSKRVNVEDVYQLPALSRSLLSTKDAVTMNRTQRLQLPDEVRSAVSASNSCKRQYTDMRTLLVPQISSALMDGRTAYSSESTSARLQQIASAVAHWRAELSVKQQTCAGLAVVADGAVHKYQSEKDNEYQSLLSQELGQGSQLQHAKGEAALTLKQSYAAVAQYTMPDLGANVRALAMLFETDRTVRDISIAVLIFFFMLDVMPIVAKLTIRPTAPYERTILAEETKLAAEADANAAVAVARSRMKTDEVDAERAGFKRFCEEDGGRVFAARVRERTFANDNVNAIISGLDAVAGLLERYLETQRSIDEAREAYPGRGDVAENLDEVERALRARTRTAAQQLGEGADREAAE